MKLKLFVLFIFNFFSIYSYSQKAEGIETQEVTIKKSFNPKVQVAKKIKSKIIISDTLTSKIENPKIFITSVPVASTFDPLKGTPKKLEILPTKENIAIVISDNMVILILLFIIEVYCCTSNNSCCFSS